MERKKERNKERNKSIMKERQSRETNVYSSKDCKFLVKVVIKQKKKNICRMQEQPDNRISNRNKFLT